MTTGVAKEVHERTANDPYLHKKILELTDTPMQRKLRAIAPIPVGAVVLPWAGMTEEDLRGEFRKMRELGFNALKQTMGTPEWPGKRSLSHCIRRRHFAHSGTAKVAGKTLRQSYSKN